MTKPPKEQRKAPRGSLATRNRGLAYGLIAPAIIWIFGIFLYSVLYNVYNSLFRVTRTGNKVFVGLQNYQKLFATKEFWDIVWNTFLWVAIITIVLEAIALFAAILLSQKIRGRGIYRTILLLPWVIPGVVTGILWKYMFDAQYGVINDVLVRVGLIDAYAPWLGQSSTALFAVIVAYIWKVFPLAMILILGSIQGIPEDVYEAADIEGAGTLQKFFFVTLPMLKDSIIATTIITMITAFSSYDLTYVMTGGGPVHSSEILGKYVYNLAFINFDYGRASATGTIMFVVSLAMIFVYVRRQNRKEV